MFIFFTKRPWLFVFFTNQPGLFIFFTNQPELFICLPIPTEPSLFLVKLSIMGTPVAGVGKEIPGRCNFSIAKTSKTFLETWRESRIGFASMISSWSWRRQLDCWGCWGLRVCWGQTLAVLFSCQVVCWWGPADLLRGLPDLFFSTGAGVLPPGPLGWVCDYLLLGCNVPHRGHYLWPSASGTQSLACC